MSIELTYGPLLLDPDSRSLSLDEQFAFAQKTVEHRGRLGGKPTFWRSQDGDPKKFMSYHSLYPDHIRGYLIMHRGQEFYLVIGVTEFRGGGDRLQRAFDSILLRDGKRG